MALDAVVDTLDGVAEGLRSCYVQDAASGKFRLDVAGGFKTASEIEGLSSALGKERARADGAEKELKALKAKLDGFDLDAGRKAMEQVARMSEDQKAREAQYEANVRARLEPVQKERDEAVKRAADAEARWESMLIDRALADSVFLKEKISKDPVHQAYVREHFRGHFRVEDGRIVAYDAPGGQKLFGADGQPIGVDAALSRLVNALPNGAALLAGSTASGSGSTAGGSYGAGQSVMRRAQFDALSPADKVKTIKAGVRVVD